ncbi:MAG: DipZ protein [Actinobacteria bacterium]|nr:DipZ protein [Actinomycetota bacterium]
MRPPDGADIPAPEFPPELTWLGTRFLRMDRLIGRHAVLVEFWDFARVNSLRTLPYLEAWHERYAVAGLQVVAIESPGYSFGRDREVATRAIERLVIPFPVALDPELALWRLYGNRGWPGRYLFDRRGLLRHYHYGEGDYEGTELAIQEVVSEIDPEVAMPHPLDPIRPEDAPGALLEAQTADVALPADRDRLELVRDWTDGEDYIEAADAGASASVGSWRAGGAWAVLSGAALAPGLYESDGTVVAEEAGLRLHGFQFTPLPPSPSGSPSGA